MFVKTKKKHFFYINKQLGDMVANPETDIFLKIKNMLIIREIIEM